ncbi:uncharacterized protein LOC108031790 isoform X2 [Drosophila biarmipes]|uniref:uncharacterized protein LOC108031790 isoform X2 n=1 Tax=Drosophila biarmipes TaxID=125945 RepID=UPI0007E6510E|nr:uncharacterized protein LOC108031790 isoform X2 [Drosophila biarmipes]
MERPSPEAAASFSEARKQILDIARNRPGTQVAKCILAYDEQLDLGSLILLLEELSKNTDYSTDLRISLAYYIEELLRHCLGSNHVSRRSAIVAAGSALQFCGKIYGDRVEYMYQVVEHQIEALLTSEPQKEPPSGSDGAENNSPKPEEPRKRRAKKLTKKEVDPYLLTVEPRKFKTMSDEKRFNQMGFVKCTRNRTIEYLYQDHTPPNLWRHAPIVDPHNPYDQDEKKQYKMFTYHVEHRYNTLLPDIPFERLNLIKEYVHTNQVNTAEILNEHMTTKDYLDEYIALENQMLAARYGATVRTRRRMDESGKRSLPGTSETEQAKKVRLEECEPMDTEDIAPAEEMDIDLPMTEENNLTTGDGLQNQISVDSGLGESMNTSQEDSTINATMDTSQVENSTLGASQVDSALSESQVQDSSLSVSQVDNSLSVSKVEDPPLSSTLATNESSVFDTTGLDLPPPKDESLEELLMSQIDSGIGMEEVSVSSHVHTDVEDHRHLTELVIRSEDVEAKTVDIMEMGEDVAVNVPREVCYPIQLNFMRLSHKALRRKCFFKLPSEFDLFKQARLPARREAQPKPPTASRALNLRTEKGTLQTKERTPESPDSLEFDEEFNFLGFRQRRPTFDSGLDVEDMRAGSGAVSTIGEVKVEVEDPTENQANKAINETMAEALDGTVNIRMESDLGESIFSELNGTTEPTTVNPSADSSKLDVTENSGTESALEATANSGMESGLETTANSGMESGFGADISSELDTTAEPNAMDSGVLDTGQLENSTLEIATQLDETTLDDTATPKDLPANIPAQDDDGVQDAGIEDCDDSIRSESPLENDNSYIPDSSSMIRDWHRRLAPALEAAHERQNFNIKDLGTEILEVCKAGNGTATLADVMADKDPSTMCRYMLASLVLTNHGNVSLHFGSRDKSKPIEMSQFHMKLKSTLRMEIHPEDDVGNMSAAKSKSAQKTVNSSMKAGPSKPVPVKTKRKSTDMASPEVFAKTVRLIQPIPKMRPTPSDADSGISSMGSSLASAPRLN